MFNNTKISRNEKEARAELLVERKGINGGKLKKEHWYYDNGKGQKTIQWEESGNRKDGKK